MVYSYIRNNSHYFIKMNLTNNRNIMEPNIICDYNDEGIDLFINYRNGFCRLTISNRCPNVAFFSTLVADKANRCGGVGTILLKQAQETAVDYGCTVMTLQAKYQSWQAAWYRRNGFEPVCDGYDANMVMMSKRLKQENNEKEKKQNEKPGARRGRAHLRRVCTRRMEYG